MENDEIKLKTDEWQELHVTRKTCSVMTEVNLAEAEVYDLLDKAYSMSLTDLCRKIDLPDQFVLLGTGALLRDQRVILEKKGRSMVVRVA